jgi:hypothetical protein
MPRRLLLLLPALFALVQGGCAVVAVGAAAAGGGAAYAYYKGKVCDEYPTSIADARAAVKTALQELHMPVLRDDGQQTSGTIESRTSDDTGVTITLETQPSRIQAEGTVTRICVRVGTFGDNPVSNRIHDQISQHLVPQGRLQPQPSTTASNGTVSSKEPPLAQWAPSPGSGPAPQSSQTATTPTPATTPSLPAAPMPIQPVQHLRPGETREPPLAPEK